MKQIIQDIKNGETQLVETPAPIVQKGQVLIQTCYSLVSSGTERMLLNFGKAGWIAKAKQQPERVQQVLSKIKSDGFLVTIDSVLRKLETPIPLGYCNAGIVIGIGEEVHNFSIGDRVISNGPHAEIVSVGKNLVAKIPDELSFEEAVFTVIGSIGLQGIRLANPTLGETFVVQGLGLVGLITAQLLKSNGCKVIGIDMDESKLDVAQKLGIDCLKTSAENSCVEDVLERTNKYGADAVIICASSTSNDIISNAAQMSRKKGRIVLVGVVGMEMNRADFFEKELSFQVSCSYGPGRYEGNYEREGLDYPIGYVRWTEQRNFEAVLSAIHSGSVDVKPLISEIISLENYQQIYDNLNKSQSIASLIQYHVVEESKQSRIILQNKNFDNASSLIGIIGSGNFTSSTMLPLLYKLNAPIKSITSNSGLTATQLAKKYNIPVVSTDYQSVLQDSSTESVIITTRHNTHAQIVGEALLQNKHVFVEKPLALNVEELKKCIVALEKSSGSLMVGYNRRFAPAAKLLKEHLQKSESSMQIVITMNAGYLPIDHWTQNMEIGGGRIIGEACHCFDLANYLTGSLAKEVLAQSMDEGKSNSDNVSVMVKYENGSTAVINYFANGSKDYPKERIEVYQKNQTAVIDNFKKLSFFGSSTKEWSGTQDKGHRDQYIQWLRFIEHGGNTLIDIESLINTSQLSFAVIESLKTGNKIII
ncbi:MAG: bi-domain-containing oxidoreductase [Saprospiraceae bacterium]